ncbi:MULTISPECIES: hypothetical protein [Staphylococcus]|uniref:Mid2-like cell wall stress sensor domain protein n=1 Tax=Staphylococcus hsinchuensis TaxID=3051183 RepID=A0ABZ3ED68_9STAP|nr:MULTISPECIES: hypothetical protein [unclassified Staphylococcus]
MKVLAITLGILVILAWVFVFFIYRQGKESTPQSQSVMLVACLLSILLTILQFFD